MTKRIVKIVFIVLLVALLVGGGVFLWYHFSHQSVTGKIAFGETYHLTEYFLDDTTELDFATSYFKVDPNRQTGELYLNGLEEGRLAFIVTNYREGSHKTDLTIEYIYKNELYQMQAESTNTEIRFKRLRKYSVSITQENPEDISYLVYNSTILVFAKEVGA